VVFAIVFVVAAVVIIIFVEVAHRYYRSGAVEHFVIVGIACGLSLQVGSRMLTSDFKDMRPKGRM
jgi:hypothetical protein